MYIDWTKNLKTQEEKTNFEHMLRSSKTVLGRLQELLQEREEGLDRSETDMKVYDLPNWESRQAHKNGFRQCLHIVNKLIDLDQQETK